MRLVPAFPWSVPKHACSLRACLPTADSDVVYSREVGVDIVLGYVRLWEGGPSSDPYRFSRALCCAVLCCAVALPVSWLYLCCAVLCCGSTCAVLCCAVALPVLCCAAALLCCTVLCCS